MDVPETIRIASIITTRAQAVKQTVSLLQSSLSTDQHMRTMQAHHKLSRCATQSAARLCIHSALVLVVNYSTSCISRCCLLLSIVPPQGLSPDLPHCHASTLPFLSLVLFNFFGRFL
jgi:hypothetical protein